jgi:molecular chaperone DnaJ
VVIRVKADDLFGRSGDDLTLTVPVTFAEAVFGTDLRVPTMDGAVTVRVPPGTPGGRTLRVRGKGVARRNGTTGDLLVTVDVHVPTSVSEQARKALQEFADATPPAPRERIDAAARRVGGGNRQ